MKTLYLDIFSGISGDMFLGAMIDLGIDAQALQRELEKLKLNGWRLRATRAQKSNISGVKLDVLLEHEPNHQHTQSEDAAHAHVHSHHHDDPEHAHSHAHGA